MKSVKSLLMALLLVGLIGLSACTVQAYQPAPLHPASQPGEATD